MTRSRIVVALEPGTPAAALRAAAGLAHGIDADLLGIFVEDLDLLRFAALPFAHEIGTVSAERRRLDTASLERDLRANAAEAGRRLVHAAAQAGVRGEFRVARGVAYEVLLSAASVVAAGDALRLLLLDDGETAPRRWAEAARGRHARGSAAPRLDIVAAPGLEELEAALRLDAPAIVVLGAGPEVLARHGLPELLRASAAPVLLVPRYPAAWSP